MGLCEQRLDGDLGDSWHLKREVGYRALAGSSSVNGRFDETLCAYATTKDSNRILSFASRCQPPSKEL
jgi:hypothetical protein